MSQGQVNVSRIAIGFWDAITLGLGFGLGLFMAYAFIATGAAIVFGIFWAIAS